MEIIETGFAGLLLLQPYVHTDGRGYFYESYVKRQLDAAAGRVDFVQENQSRSSRGVVRGLHFQRPPHAQAKLVRVVEGTVLDVAVDLRRGSPTYGRHAAYELSADNCRQLFIPRGFAHGFTVLSDTATFIYLCDNYYAPESEGGIAWDDPALGIDWKLGGLEPSLSDKDRRHPVLAEFDTPF